MMFYFSPWLVDYKRKYMNDSQFWRRQAELINEVKVQLVDLRNRPDSLDQDSWSWDEKDQQYTHDRP